MVFLIGNYRVLKRSALVRGALPCFIIAKNYRVLKHRVPIFCYYFCFIIAKNYRVLKQGPAMMSSEVVLS